MKKTLSFAAMAAALSLSLQGCINDRIELPDGNSPIGFTASIGDKTHILISRASDSPDSPGASWGDDADIGVYMFAARDAAPDSLIAGNVKHSHIGDGRFLANVEDPDDALYYPKDGCRVDFVAYHPHRDDVDEYRYPIDVSDQSDPAAIDFMYSDNATECSAGSPFLRFRHKMVKLVFNVTDEDGGPLDELTATIAGMNASGVFDLSTGALMDGDGEGEEPSDETPERGGDGEETASLSGETENEGTSGEGETGEGEEEEADPNIIEPLLVAAEEATASLEAIVLPCDDLDVVVTFLFADGGKAILTLDGATYLEGRVYTYNITVGSFGEPFVVGGSGIDDWENGWEDGDTSGERSISKIPPGGGDGGGGDGESEEYYLETFGTDDLSAPGDRVEIGEFTGWSSGYPAVTYLNSGDALVEVRSTAGKFSNDPYMWFPSSYTSDVVIDNLPEGYSDITFSCDIACQSGTEVNPVKIWVGDTDVTPSSVGTLSTIASTFTVPLPDGATSMRLVTTPLRSIRIDNIRLEGRK